MEKLEDRLPESPVSTQELKSMETRILDRVGALEKSVLARFQESA